MNKKLLTLLPILLISSQLVVSCGNDSIKYKNSKVTIEINNGNENGKIYSPKDVEIIETRHSIENKLFYNTRVLPSIGNVNILVIPILLPGYDVIDIDGDGENDLSKVRSDLQSAFFGKEGDENLGFDSVATYYKKSSYGKLNISGTVTNWYNLAISGLNYTDAAQIDFYQTYDVVEKAVEWAKANASINISDYDNDKDGYIDGVWCIYSSPNYQNGGPYTDYNNYWAYTSWGNQTPENGGQKPNVSNPIYNLFGWASYDFMYLEYEDKLDTHTYIHETGHFLGLNDYYSDTPTYSPIGKHDMMDANVGDHNSYSKMLLGWTKPYLVTGNGTIDLYSMENENNFIVIPDDSYDGNGEFDPFSEYMLIELYTNDNLNYLDSVKGINNIPLSSTNPGVRIYHVDNRKFIVDFESTYNVTSKIYEGETIDDTHRLILPISNSRNLDTYNSSLNLDPSVNIYDEIRLIEATNEDTFSFGGYQKDKTYFNNNVFSLETYGNNFFVNRNKFNNGNLFSYEITIKEVQLNNEK